jgi:hypothetical protein
MLMVAAQLDLSQQVTLPAHPHQQIPALVATALALIQVRTVAVLVAPVSWLFATLTHSRQHLLLPVHRHTPFLVDSAFINGPDLVQSLGDIWLILHNLTKTTSLFRSS